MNRAAHLPRTAELDDPWRRLPWVAVAALLLWAGLLAAFALLLGRSGPEAPEPKPLEARIVEIAPPATAGLAAGKGGASPPAPKASAKPRPAHVPTAVHRKAAEPAPAPPSPAPPENGAAASSASPTAPATSEGGAVSGESGSSGGARGDQGGTGGGDGGIGSDSLGARAVYTPMPEIPDDLREDAIQTVAVAHFKVSADGQVSVSLTTETANPRLNQILLETLRQWRFFPASKDGVAINSEFDIRIPVSVQ